MKWAGWLLLAAALGCGKGPDPAKEGESCNYKDVVTRQTVHCAFNLVCVKTPGCFDCSGKCVRTCVQSSECLGACRCAASTDNPAYNVCVGPDC